MPKENIHCVANRGPTIHDDGRADRGEPWRAEVQWSGGDDNQLGFVMVGTINPQSPFDWQQVNKDDPERQFDGWFVSLDRAGCNRMIRALRRARDQAYGADA